MTIPCFFLEPTDRIHKALRRYSHEKCSAPEHWIHDAQTPIEPGTASWHMENNRRYRDSHDHEKPPKDDARWPIQCECGYKFTTDDEWQLWTELIYKRQDTGEEMTLRDAPDGAMWYADWMPDCWKGPDGHSLVVRVPNKHDWIVDSQASNCTMPDDKEHRCWCRSGTPPNITVSKQGCKTCAAGAGSIQTPAWHGFLRNGVLEG